MTMVPSTIVINSTVCSNLLPDAYTMNDFEGLFDNVGSSTRVVANQVPVSVQQSASRYCSVEAGVTIDQQTPQNVITTPLLSSLFPVTSLPNFSPDVTNKSIGKLGKRPLEAGLYGVTGATQSVVASHTSLTNLAHVPFIKSNKKRKHMHVVKQTNLHASQQHQENASKQNSGNQFVYKPVIGSSLPKVNKEESPANLLWRLFKLRSTDDITLKKSSCSKTSSKYYHSPSPLQKASFGAAIVKAANSSDLKALELLLSCGLSPNPCNSFGDSVLNTVCRRGDEQVFKVFMDCGASIYTMDSFSRTVLHYLCWSNDTCFSCVEYILERDPEMLIIEDKFGKTPLDYVSSPNWGKWKKFILYNDESLCAKLSDNINKNTNRKEKSLKEDEQSDSLGTTEERYLPNPPSYAPIEIVKELSSGSLSPAEFLKTRQAPNQ